MDQVTTAPAAINWTLEILKIAPSVIVAAAVGFAGYRIGKRQVGIADGQLKLSKNQLELSKGQFELAKGQKEIAEAKLKLDLFEERYKIFLDTWTILSETVFKGTAISRGNFSTPFNNYFPRATFLFGTDVEVFLKKAVQNWADLAAIDTRTKFNNDVMKPDDIDLHYKLMDWFGNAAMKECKEIFGRYMSFEKWQ